MKTRSEVRKVVAVLPLFFFTANEKGEILMIKENSFEIKIGNTVYSVEAKSIENSKATASETVRKVIRNEAMQLKF